MLSKREKIKFNYNLTLKRSAVLIPTCGGRADAQTCPVQAQMWARPSPVFGI